MTGGWCLVIPVLGDFYAVPMTSVREVVRGARLTRLPTTPAAVLGLFNLRGEIVPLLDTASMLGIGHMDAIPFAVVLHSAGGPVGLAASEVPEAVTLAEPIGPSEAPGTLGVFALQQRLVVLIDVEPLLQPERIGGGDQLLVGLGGHEA